MKINPQNDSIHKDLIDNLYDGVYFVDKERRIVYWNKGAERITGYLSDFVVGSFCHNNLLNHVTDSGKHLCEDGCPLLATLQDGKPREADVHLRHAEGHRVPVLVRVSPIYDDDENIVGAVEVFSNNLSLFQIRRKVTELERLALFDALTGLSNRRFAETKVKSALLEFNQHQIPFGLLMMDVDRFKNINDTYGHPAGDQVLRVVAKNLFSHLRDTDVCARWGGEEFLSILMNMDAARLTQTAEKLRIMIEQSLIQVDQKNFNLTVSIGATLVRAEDTYESLVERADRLLYKSKSEGRNRVSFQE